MDDFRRYTPDSMIVVVEIGSGRLPQDISAASILWPSQSWKYPGSSVERFSISTAR